jgi:hypothetical protein
LKDVQKADKRCPRRDGWCGWWVVAGDEEERKEREEERR